MSVTVAPAATTRWFRNALLGLGLSAAAGTALLVTGPVDPVHELLSNAVRSGHGTLLLALAAGGLALAGGWLCVGAHRGLPRNRLLLAMLGLWSAGLVAVAIFPTNLPGTPVTTAALIHRYGAGLAGALPPLTALLVAELAGRRAETARVRLLRAAGTGTLWACLAFAAAHGHVMLSGASVSPYTGLAERVLLALVLVVTALTAWVINREERSRWT